MKHRLIFRDVGRSKAAFELVVDEGIDDEALARQVRHRGRLMSDDILVVRTDPQDGDDRTALFCGSVLAGMHRVGRFRAYTLTASVPL